MAALPFFSRRAAQPCELLTARSRREALEGVVQSAPGTPGTFRTELKNPFGEPWIAGLVHEAGIDFVVCWSSRRQKNPDESRSYYTVRLPVPEGYLPIAGDGKRVLKCVRSGQGLTLIIGDLALNQSNGAGICNPFEQLSITRTKNTIEVSGKVLRAEVRGEDDLDQLHLPLRPR